MPDMTQTRQTTHHPHLHYHSTHLPPHLNGTSYATTPATSTPSDGVAFSDTPALSINGDIDSGGPKLLRLEDVFVQGTEEEQEEAQLAVDRINAVRIRAHKRQQDSVRRQSLQASLEKHLAEESAIDAQLDALSAQRRFIEEERTRLLTQAENLFARHRELADKKAELIQTRAKLAAEIAGAADTVHSSIDVPLVSYTGPNKVKRSVNVVAPSDTQSVASVPIVATHLNGVVSLPPQHQQEKSSPATPDRPTTVGTPEEGYHSRYHFSLRRRSGIAAGTDNGNGISSTRAPRPASFIWRRASMPAADLAPADLHPLRKTAHTGVDTTSDGPVNGSTTPDGSHAPPTIRGRGGAGAHRPPSRSGTLSSYAPSFMSKRLSLLVPHGPTTATTTPAATPTTDTAMPVKKRMDILAFYAMGGESAVVDHAGQKSANGGHGALKEGEEEERIEEIHEVQTSRRATAAEI